MLEYGQGVDFPAASKGFGQGALNLHIQEGKGLQPLPHRAGSRKAISAPYPFFLFIFHTNLFILSSYHFSPSLPTFLQIFSIGLVFMYQNVRQGRSTAFEPRKGHGASLATSFGVKVEL